MILNEKKQKVYDFHLKQFEEIQKQKKEKPFVLVHVIPMIEENEYLVDFANESIKDFVEDLTEISGLRYTKLNFKGLAFEDREYFMQWHRNGCLEVINSYYWRDQSLSMLEFVKTITVYVLSAFELFRKLDLDKDTTISVLVSISQPNEQTLSLQFPIGNNKLPTVMNFPALIVSMENSSNTLLETVTKLAPIFNSLTQTVDSAKLNEGFFQNAFWKDRQPKFDNLIKTTQYV